MAKNPSGEMAQPAYCDAMQLTIGWSVQTVSPGQDSFPIDHRPERNIAQPAHADLGERETGIVAAGHMHAAVDDAGAVREGVHLATQQVGMFSHAIRDVARKFTHAKRLHAGLHARISPLPVSAKSPL